MKIFIDWLQYSGYFAHDNFANLPEEFTIKKTSISTRQFKTIEELFYYNNRLATICRHPSSPILRADTVLIKIDNKFLYETDIFVFIPYVFRIITFIPRKISRIDFAYDFLMFQNNLLPENFIKKFISETFKKKGKSKFTIFGKHDKANKFQYLKFGSNLSPVTCYLYNKTDEMKEVKLKPWIATEHAKIDNKNALPVWRLEFSIKGNTLKFLDKMTGEMQELSDFTTLIMSRRAEIFFSLFNKYFFFTKDISNKNSSRWKQDLRLIDFETSFSPYRITETKDSNRSAKTFLNKLNSLNDELRQANNDLQQEAADLIFYYRSTRKIS